MLKIRFYGGAGTIGGNMIQVSIENTSILFDIGKSYDVYDRFFGMGYRNYPMEFEDLVISSLIPRELAGKFFIDKNVQKPVGSSPIDAVFVSHSHFDHSWYIPLVRDDVPIYMNKIAYTMYRSAVGKPRGGRSIVDKNVQGEIPSFPNVKTLTTENKSIRALNFDDFNVLYGPVDHSIPGAYAYALEYEDKLLLYTGDFRLHGMFSEKRKSFLDMIEDRRSDYREIILITEGTNWGSEEPFLNEKQVEENVREMLRRHYKDFKTAIALVSPNDVDRVRELFKAASLAAFDEGKYLKPFVDHTVAKLLTALNAEKLLEPIPRIGECIEAGTTTEKKGKTGPLRVMLLGEKRYTKKGEAKKGDWHGYLVHTLGVKDEDIIGMKELASEIDENDNSRYFILLSSFNLDPFYLKKIIKPSSLVLFSTSEPFKEELILDYEKKVNQLMVLGARIARVHTTGHVRPEDHVDLLARLKPDIVLPVHTEYPEYISHLLTMAKIKSRDRKWNPKYFICRQRDVVSF
ncbi:MAG: MBL fold metallo-hydrolase [Thermoproteales archaeon]|nr:MBL fold metallo-hydrolase [Thermoproteales archaeon]